MRSRNDSAVRLGALAALWLSLLLVMYWWVADGGVQIRVGVHVGIGQAGIFGQF